MAATVEQAIMALNLQLIDANAQIGLMSNALDALRTESVAAVQDLRRQLASAATTGGKQKDVSFINTKNFEGGRFSGSAKESFKAWSKKVKTYLNSQVRGMRQALELSEETEAKVPNRKPQAGQLTVRSRGQREAVRLSADLHGRGSVPSGRAI